MQHSTRPIEEVSAVTGALVRLAAATRDTSIDDKVISVYMPHLDKYDVDEIVDACVVLEREAEWFPKVKELLEACSQARRRKQDAALTIQRELTGAPYYAPIDPQRLSELMARVKALGRSKAMPKVEVANDPAVRRSTEDQR